MGERAGVLRQAADDDVERAVAQQLDQPVAGVDDDFERDERVGLLHFEQGIAQVLGQRNHDAADVNLLRAAEAQLVQLLAQAAHRAAQAAAGVHHRQPGRVELEAAPLALEQRLADGFLEFVQHLAGGGGGHAEVLRGGVQRPLLVDGQHQ